MKNAVEETPLKEVFGNIVEYEGEGIQISRFFFESHYPSVAGDAFQMI